ncbi:MAG: CrcB family protein [Opitutales bacterium]|nr:CrcB family protein [Opitutales bacterium]
MRRSIDIRELAAVAAAGAAGAAARYVCLEFFCGYFILFINVSGSLLFGYFKFRIASARLKSALTYGFCGGFTTLSTFSVYAAILGGSSLAAAAAFVLLNLALSVAAIFAGRFLAGKAGACKC